MQDMRKVGTNTVFFFYRVARCDTDKIIDTQYNNIVTVRDVAVGKWLGGGDIRYIIIILFGKTVI